MAQTAIEYGTSRLRLLEFDGSGRKIRVLEVAEADLEVVGRRMVCQARSQRIGRARQRVVTPLPQR